MILGLLIGSAIASHVIAENKNKNATAAASVNHTTTVHREYTRQAGQSTDNRRIIYDPNIAVNTECVSCGAPLAGRQGTMVKCPYCETIQALPIKYESTQSGASANNPRVLTGKVYVVKPNTYIAYSTADSNVALKVLPMSDYRMYNYSVVLRNTSHTAIRLPYGSTTVAFEFNNSSYSRYLSITESLNTLYIDCSHEQRNNIAIKSGYNRNNEYYADGDNAPAPNLRIHYNTSDSGVALKLCSTHFAQKFTFRGGEILDMRLASGRYLFYFYFNGEEYTKWIVIDERAGLRHMYCTHAQTNEISIS